MHPGEHGARRLTSSTSGFRRPVWAFRLYAFGGVHGPSQLGWNIQPDGACHALLRDLERDAIGKAAVRAGSQRLQPRRLHSDSAGVLVWLQSRTSRHRPAPISPRLYFLRHGRAFLRPRHENRRRQTRATRQSEQTSGCVASRSTHIAGRISIHTAIGRSNHKTVAYCMGSICLSSVSEG